jgi:hypothetical protein
VSGNAWPFVVARNRLLDWRPIVAPQFMVEDKSSFLLTYEAVHDGGSDSSQPARRLVAASRSGALTLVFRTIAPLPNGGGTDQPLDKVGRPIFLVTGVVVKGDAPNALATWGPQLSQIDQLARCAFDQFWGAENEDYMASLSGPLSLGDALGDAQGLAAPPSTPHLPVGDQDLAASSPPLAGPSEVKQTGRFRLTRGWRIAIVAALLLAVVAILVVLRRIP